MGPQTHRNIAALVKGRISDFVVFFQPTGFYRLFRVPMIKLTDRTFEASDVVGREVHFPARAAASIHKLREVAGHVFARAFSFMASVASR